jgi:hypothetical protein
MKKNSKGECLPGVCEKKQELLYFSCIKDKMKRMKNDKTLLH